MVVISFMPALEGFFLGAGLIIAIGAQNAFILRQGLRGKHVFILATICFISDALLITAGALGVGSLVAANPEVTKIAAIGGGGFLIIYGILSFKSAFKAEALTISDNDKDISLTKAISVVLALTFLNPHVYLDTVVLMGSISGRYLGNERLLFVIGAVIASAIWFYGLGYGARILRPIFAKKIAWRILDILIGVIMWMIAYAIIAKFIFN